MIISGLISYLETQSNVTALLAYHPRAKTTKHAIYAGAPAEGSPLPLLIITLTDGEDIRSLDGDQGLADALIDIEIQTEQAQGYGKLEQIREELRQSLTTNQVSRQ